MVTATPAPAPQGHCNQCRKIWTLNERQGVCPLCGKRSLCQTRKTKPRQIQFSRRQRQRQAGHNGNGYDHMEGEWLTYYKVASKHAHRAKPDDTEDLLHTIILTLSVAERNNGHKPFTLGTMHRIASRCVSDYWFNHYEINNGLDCRHCSKAQRAKCKQDDLYTECPKAIKLESLSKPIVDGEGNLTTLGELIADPESLDIDAWDKDYLWQLGYKPRQVDIANKLHRGEALTPADSRYLYKLRTGERKRLF